METETFSAAVPIDRRRNAEPLHRAAQALPRSQAQRLLSSPPLAEPFSVTPGLMPRPRLEAAQRILDVLLTGVLLALLLPAFLAIALLIRIDSPGPVLFRQTRVGKDGRGFPFFKFRSMYQDAEARRHTLDQLNQRSGPVFKMRDDPRITRVGRFLRRTSLDELPQLINILRGDMSLVGPRPALPQEVSQYSPDERLRLEVTPGLTGLWQVSGRADLSFDESIALDLHYIRCRSVGLYLQILLRTVPAVLQGKGAY